MPVSNLQKNNETVCDDNGFTIFVNYNYEKSPPQIEEGHGLHNVGGMVYTEIISVFVTISNQFINITVMLNDNQKQFIISKLTYE